MSNEQHDQLDATNGIGSVIETGDVEEVSMILGHKDKLRCAGLVRPGVKVIKNSCTAAEKAKFKELEAQGMGYDAIDIALGGKPKSNTSKLFPSNADFFVVRDCDFKKPADAQYIRQHYADPDGKVRRFPVWFTIGEIDRVLPHNFKAFDGSGSVRCASFYDGKVLKFRYVPKGLQNPKQDDWQILDSDDEDVATKACGYKVTFGGMYRVNVVGLRGLEEVIVPTKSWYGIGYSVATLRRVRSILGRFDGLVNGQPIFELCKVQEEVTTPDGKKQNQWLVTLELSLDPIEIARYAEPQAVAARSAHALQMLTGRALAAPVAAAPAPVADPVPEAETQDQAEDAAISPRRQRCLGYLQQLAEEGLHLDVSVLYTFIASQKQGVTVEDLSDDDLATVCSAIQASVKHGLDGFKADLLAAVGQ